MICDRAIALLSSLQGKSFDAEAYELDELIAAELVVETDHSTLTVLWDLIRLTNEYPDFLGPSWSLETVAATRQHVRRKLGDDWYRMWRSKTTLAAMEADERALRRAQSLMSELTTASLLHKAANERLLLSPKTVFVACPRVGRGLFAITRRGREVLAALEVRRDRFGDAKLGVFLAQHSKVDAKVSAFSREVQALSERVGPLAKGKAHVVAGLMKANRSAVEVASLYQSALLHSDSPYQAATCARHASGAGGTHAVQQRLRAAYQALVRAGMPMSPVVEDAAKSLLPFDQPDVASLRFSALVRHLREVGVEGELLYKLAGRLMSAYGAPGDLVRRVSRTAHQLYLASEPHRQRSGHIGRVSVALASMARSNDAVEPLCERFLETERLLAGRLSCSADDAEAYALECVAAPGTPAEVVSTVVAVAMRIAGQGEVTSEHVTVAAAFAKRFAY